MKMITFIYNMSVVWAASANCDVGNLTSNTQDEEWISIHVIIFITVPVYLFIHCQGELYKNTIHNLGYGVTICSTFLQNEFLMS